MRAIGDLHHHRMEACNPRQRIWRDETTQQPGCWRGGGVKIWSIETSHKYPFLVGNFRRLKWTTMTEGSCVGSSTRNRHQQDTIELLCPRSYSWRNTPTLCRSSKNSSGQRRWNKWKLMMRAALITGFSDSFFGRLEVGLIFGGNGRSPIPLLNSSLVGILLTQLLKHQRTTSAKRGRILSECLLASL